MDENANQTEVNIEEIMQEIRQHILAKKDAPNQSGSTIVPLAGKRLPPEFFEHLYQANLVFDQIGIKMLVTKTNVPIIGWLLDKLRVKIHELMLFYVNQLAEQQIQFNTHMLQAMSLLTQNLEEENQ